MRVGVVITTNGEEAEVSTAKRGLCGNCGKEAACALPIGPIDSAVEQIIAGNPIGAAAGDTVELDLVGHTELKLSLLVWVVPLLGLLAGAVGGFLLAGPLTVEQDPAVLVGALVGVGLAYGALRSVDRRVAGDRSLVPIITRVLESSTCAALPADAAGDRAAEPQDGL